MSAASHAVEMLRRDRHEGVVMDCSAAWSADQAVFVMAILDLNIAFQPLAAAYALGVLASLAGALTVTPALSVILLPKAIDRTRPSPVLRRLEASYGRALPAILHRHGTWLGLGGAAVALSGVGLYCLESALLPEFKENDFLMHWVAQPGTSLSALQRTTLRVSPELRALQQQTFIPELRVEPKPEAAALGFLAGLGELDADEPRHHASLVLTFRICVAVRIARSTRLHARIERCAFSS